MINRISFTKISIRLTKFISVSSLLHLMNFTTPNCNRNLCSFILYWIDRASYLFAHCELTTLLPILCHDKSFASEKIQDETLDRAGQWSRKCLNLVGSNSPLYLKAIYRLVEFLVVLDPADCCTGINCTWINGFSNPLFVRGSDFTSPCGFENPSPPCLLPPHFSFSHN